MLGNILNGGRGIGRGEGADLIDRKQTFHTQVQTTHLFCPVQAIPNKCRKLIVVTQIALELFCQLQ